MSDPSDPLPQDPTTTLSERIARLDPVAVAAVALAGVGLFCASFTWTAAGVIFLSAIALIVGVARCFQLPDDNAIDRIIAAGASLFSFVVLVAAVFVPGLLGPRFAGTDWAGWPFTKPRVAPTYLAAPYDTSGMNPVQAVSDSDWVDASVNAAQQHDLRVRVLEARVGKLELINPGKFDTLDKKAKPPKYLSIRVRVSYESPIFRRLEHKSWADTSAGKSSHPAKLTDQKGQPLEQIVVNPAQKLVGRDENQFVTPGHQMNETFVFPAPSADLEYLRLELPASSFGEPGTFRLQIPKKMIQGL